VKLTALSCALAFSCGGPATVAPPPERASASPPPAPRAARSAHVDVLAALAADPLERSWVAPGPLQLELGTTPIQAEREGVAVEAVLLDDQGSLVRAGIELPNARFAAWIERTRVFGVMVHEARVLARDGSDFQPGGDEPMQATLRAGARVKRLAHDHDWTRVRYYGQLEIEGWVHDADVSDRAAARDGFGRVPRATQVLTVLPGSTIRTEPKWAAHPLATMADGYFVDALRDVDDSWVEVEYEDSDARVHGFLSKHEPPSRVHRPRESDAIATIAPNAKLVAGTCLYAREGGEAIGFVVGESVAEESPGTRTGWFAVTLDTPWGPITFGAQGPNVDELEKCGPATSP
jgi:hypothetical protein